MKYFEIELFQSVIKNFKPPSHQSRNAMGMKNRSTFMDNFYQCFDCILSAFQVFGPILVASPNVLLMLKTFEVDSKWRNIERHPKYSKIYTRNVLESFEVGSKDVQSIRTTYTCRSICNSLPKYGAIFLISSFRLVLLNSC